VQTLNLKIFLMSTNPTYRGSHDENAKLTLTTIAKITYNTKINKPTLGRWMCPSIYVGKTLQGSYYVTWLDALDPRDNDRPRMDGSEIVRDVSVVNPVGIFFDDSEGPDAGGFGFMTLYKFAPEHAVYDHGFGMFNKSDINLVSSGLDWSRI
jgi:hypothetical protein